MAAAGITDFVLPGEKKISEEEYRFLWKQIGELSLMRTKENAPAVGAAEAH
ncbi:hypothetical protein [Morganella morganii IS15]|nr:putative phage regulatory protein [Morganella morganii]EMP51312.1 hypothetical protein C790_01227 [Morganella morganii SC01]MBT0318593.1 hypothetical protein [Morganella morganii subsp. morganii]MBT0318639.1 hypothetical protein [Morganella morganii subsp. morganii]CDK66133.1 hypothetical protein [Morganella morganii IS15]